MPKGMATVLVSTEHKEVYVAWFTDAWNAHFGTMTSIVTHWMPLPSAPSPESPIKQQA